MKCVYVCVCVGVCCVLLTFHRLTFAFCPPTPAPHHPRLQDFQMIKTIGRGAFGEVRARGDGDAKDVHRVMLVLQFAPYFDHLKPVFVHVALHSRMCVQVKLVQKKDSGHVYAMKILRKVRVCCAYMLGAWRWFCTHRHTHTHTHMHTRARS